jgi:hypothetical protein
VLRRTLGTKLEKLTGNRRLEKIAYEETHNFNSASNVRMLQSRRVKW